MRGSHTCFLSPQNRKWNERAEKLNANFDGDDFSLSSLLSFLMPLSLPSPEEQARIGTESLGRPHRHYLILASPESCRLHVMVGNIPKSEVLLRTRAGDWRQERRGRGEGGGGGRAGRVSLEWSHAISSFLLVLAMRSGTWYWTMWSCFFWDSRDYVLLETLSVRYAKCFFSPGWEMETGSAVGGLSFDCQRSVASGEEVYLIVSHYAPRSSSSESSFSSNYYPFSSLSPYPSSFFLSLLFFASWAP